MPRIRDFAPERYFARWEFSARHLLSAPDCERRDEELLATKGVLGEGLHLGPREIYELTTNRAAGLARCRCKRRPDRPPRDTAKAAEELTHMLTERQELGPDEALNCAPMEA